MASDYTMESMLDRYLFEIVQQREQLVWFMVQLDCDLGVDKGNKK